MTEIQQTSSNLIKQTTPTTVKQKTVLPKLTPQSFEHQARSPITSTNPVKTKNQTPFLIVNYSVYNRKTSQGSKGPISTAGQNKKQLAITVTTKRVTSAATVAIKTTSTPANPVAVYHNVLQQTGEI